MSYLLWQIFWCLAGTALLFFAVGWLFRPKFGRNTGLDSLPTDSEQRTWQTSLDGLKARLEAETSRKLALEKALEDSHSQQAKLSSLLDQQAVEIQSLSHELNEKTHALEQSEASAAQLQPRLMELETQLADHNAKLAAAVSASAEVPALRARLADLEPKLRAAEENGKLQEWVSELTPKLTMAAAAGAEAVLLKARVPQLELQVSKLQSFAGKFQAVGGGNGHLAASLAEVEPQLTVAELSEKLLRKRPQPELVAPPIHPDLPPSDERDDLKKIYGIGPVLERRLHALGVFYFRDIASWNKEDVRRYEDHLKEFRRIERDKWVEGAREEHFKKYGEQLFKADAAGA